MVDHEVDGHQRVDLLGVAAKRHHRVAHRRKVDDGGNAGEILHQHAGRAEGDFLVRLAAIRHPADQGLDVGFLDGAAVFVAQQVFQQDFHRHGQR